MSPTLSNTFCIIQIIFNPFPNDTFLDSSRLKEFADDNFKFGENGTKFSKRLENTVGKGEIAFNQHFLFSHCVFKRYVLQTRKNKGLFWKGVNLLSLNAM